MKISRKTSLFLFAVLTVALIIFSACGGNVDTGGESLQEKATQVTLSPDTLILTEGETFSLTADVQPESRKDVLTFRSDDETVAVVDSGGKITALKEGKTRVYATADDISAFVEITVSAPLPDPVAPQVDFAASEFQLDLAETDCIWGFYNVTPSGADVEIEVEPEALVDGDRITFTEKGEYTVTVKATNDGITVFKSVKITVEDSNALSGKGTAENPYLISDEQDLKILVKRNNVLEEDFSGSYFVQTKDVELSGEESWEPIGLSGIPFAGNYDGEGHEISGLYINTSRSFQGLFGFLTGSVKNLTVRGEITVIYPDGPYSHSFAGGIAGAANNGALIENCVNYVNVTGDSYVGGIVGEVSENDLMFTDAVTVVKNCVNYGTVRGITDNAVNEAAMYFGGIAGRNNGIIVACVNRGTVIVETDKDNAKYLGGITGINYYPYKTGMEIGDKEQYALRDCENYGEIKGYRNVGGIVGNAALPVLNCKNFANVSGSVCTGGITGLAGTIDTYASDLGRVEECENYGSINAGLRHGGGIAGYTYVDVLKCVNAAPVSGNNGVYNLGGIVGTVEFNGKISGCENKAEGKVTGLYGLGGIIGWYTRCSENVSDCKNYADITSTKIYESSGNHVGGIVGMLGSDNGAINCVNSGAVSAGGGVSGSRSGGVGGIAGSMYSNSKISGCENSGKIFGISRLGGIVGFAQCNTLSEIYKSVNRGVVESSLSGDDPALTRSNTGCIVGYIISGRITDCENYGHYIVAVGKVINYGYNYGLADNSPVVSGFVNHYKEV